MATTGSPGFDYGYGYPMGGAGSGSRRPMGAQTAGATSGYQNARPGYEVRILIASANILAQHRPTSSHVRTCSPPPAAFTRSTWPTCGAAECRWRTCRVGEIGRLPTRSRVTGKDTSFRSDQLLGTDVRDAQDEALGSVDDLVVEFRRPTRSPIW